MNIVKPSKRVLSPEKNMEDIISYKNALEYREVVLLLVEIEIDS